MQNENANIIIKTLHEQAKPQQLSVIKVVQVAVYCVEQIASQVRSGMTSEEKLKAAIGMLPGIVEQAVAHGMCTPEQAQRIGDEIAQWGPAVEQAIEVIVAVAHSPELVQLEKWCKAKCGSCISRR